MLPSFWSVETAIFHSSLVKKSLHFGHVILFVSSGFLETEGPFLTALINRSHKDTGRNDTATPLTEVTVGVTTDDCRPH